MENEKKRNDTERNGTPTINERFFSRKQNGNEKERTHIGNLFLTPTVG